MKKYWNAGVFFVAALSLAVGVRAITSYIAASAAAPMQIQVSSLQANGLTPRDFNTAFLRSLQAYVSEDTKRQKREVMQREGLSPEKIEAELDHLSSQAAYIEGDKKLAVVRIQTPAWNSVVTVGLVNGNLKQVVCAHSSPELITISHGLCGEKIYEVFDTEIP
jgi:hypothetical protein